MTLLTAPAITLDQLGALSSDDLIALARGLRHDDADADIAIETYRTAYAASMGAIAQAFVTLHAPFAVGERLRLIADASEWTVVTISTAPLRFNGPTVAPRYSEIVMQRYNRDGRLGEVTRTYTFMAGNAADVARFERVGV